MARKKTKAKTPRAFNLASGHKLLNVDIDGRSSLLVTQAGLVGFIKAFSISQPTLYLYLGFLHLQKGSQIDELRAPQHMGALLEADGHSPPPTGLYSCASHSSWWRASTQETFLMGIMMVSYHRTRVVHANIHPPFQDSEA